MNTVIEALERRALLDGTLDPSYGTNGVVLTSFRNTADAIAMAFQKDGKQVVVGDTDQQSTGKDIFVARYNSDGTLDSTFGTGGVTFLDLGGDDIATTVKIQSDGKIVAAGTTGAASGATGDAWVGRWTSAGKLDRTFNKIGYRVVDFGGVDAVSGMLLERPRTSTTTTAAGIAKKGLASTTSTNSDVVLSGASLNLLGQTSSIVIAKLNGDGSMDTRFGPGTGVFLSLPGKGIFEGATSLSRFGSRFLVSGFQFTPASLSSHFMLAAIDCDCGYLDTNFGVGGRAIVNFGNNVELAMDARYDPYTNTIVAVGVMGTGLTELPPGLPTPRVTGIASSASFAIARFLNNGQLDTSFNHTGMSVLDFPGYKAAASGLVIQSDHKLIVGGGGQSLSSGLSDFTLGRFNWDGTLDTGFGNGGRIVKDLGSSDGAFRLFDDCYAPGYFYAIGHSKFNSLFGRAALLRYLIDEPPFGTRPPLFGVSNVHWMAAPTLGELKYRVRLSHAPTSPLTVHYATRDGSMLAGTDYDATSGDLTFQPGERSKTIMVPYHDSHGGTTPGTIDLDLSSPGAGAMLVNPTATAWLNFLRPNLNAARVQSVMPVGFPKTIVGGQKSGNPMAKVTIKNFGTKPITGSETLKVYGSTDWRIDAKSDPLLGTMKANLSIKPGKSQTFSVPVTSFPKTALDTGFHLLGSASGAGVTNPSTNFARSDDTFLVTTPTVTLIGSSTNRPAITLSFGQKGQISFPLTDVGTVQALGTGSIEIDFTTDGTLASLKYYLFPKTVLVNIAPGKTATIALSVRPPTTGVIPAGKYIALARLLSTKLQYKNTTDGSTVAMIPVMLK